MPQQHSASVIERFREIFTKLFEYRDVFSSLFFFQINNEIITKRFIVLYHRSMKSHFDWIEPLWWLRAISWFDLQLFSLFVRAHTLRPIRWWWWMIIVWMFYETTSIDNDRLSGKRENIDKNALKKKQQFSQNLD